MSKVIYAKYNRNRRKNFQISTAICEENGKRYTKKSPLTKEAEKHIQGMQAFYGKLRNQYTNIVLVPGKFENGEMICDFIEGKSLSDLLTTALYEMEKEEFFKYLARQLDTIFSSRVPLEKYEKTKEFEHVFGDVDVDGTSMPITNVDLIFDNIVQHGNEYVCLDYEWVFDFPIPVDFVKFRSLHYFYAKNVAFLKTWLSEEELLALFGIEKDCIVPYSEMEANFQKWVFGTDNYFKNYVQQEETDVLARYDSCLSRVLQLQDEVEERNKHMDHLNHEIESLMADREKLLAVSENADHELKNKQQQLENFANMNAQLQMVNGQLQKVNDQLQLVTEKLQAENEQSQMANGQLQSENEQLQQENQRLECALDMLRNEKRDQDNLVRQLEDLTTRMDAHIKGIQPGYEKWMRLTNNKLVRFPKRAVKKAYHVLKDQKPIKKMSVPRTANPVVSIVIPVYNQFDYTYECIKSIIEFTKDVPYEIIVGDDVSTDETRKLEKYIRGIKVIHNTENLKFLLNCNNAAKQASGKYIFFLNNDTKVTEGWLSSLVELIESDDSIGMVGSKLVYPDGRLQEAGGIVFQDGSGWNYGRCQDPAQPEYNYVKDVDYISGAAIMIRTELWKEIGGFDELFVPAYYEDTDLAFQVREKGYRVVYQPKSVVIHFEGVSNGTDVSSGLKQYQVVNAERFQKKWEKQLQEQHCSGPDELFLARDRSRNKKVIVFIDHYVPHFDKDAGSKSTFSYIKAFLRMGYSVKFIGDNFFKHEPYTTVLQQMGVEVLYGDWYYLNWQEWIEKNGKYFDVVFMNRPHITIKYIELLKQKTQARLIYYGHDLHYIRERREYEITKDEETLKDAEKMHQTEYVIMRMADVVYYPSYVEVDIIKAEDPSIKARAIPVYVYEEPYKGTVLPLKERKDLMFIGGFGHKPNADAVLWFVQEIFPTVLKALPDVKFYILGSNPPQEILDLASENVIVKGFVSDEELEKIYRTCRLDVVPLRYGAGMKGKVIEGIYNHIPLLTTSIGAEGLQNYDGVIAVEDEAQAFAERVISMYQDEAELTKMVEASAEYIQKYFSLDAALEILKRDL